jgi:phage shock protein A
MSDFARLRAKARDIVDTAGALMELNEFLDLLAQAGQIRLDLAEQQRTLDAVREQVADAGETLVATRQTTADELRTAKDVQQRALALREEAVDVDIIRKRAKATAELDAIAAQVEAKKGDLVTARHEHTTAISRMNHEVARVSAQIGTLEHELAALRTRVGLPPVEAA